MLSEQLFNPALNNAQRIRKRRAAGASECPRGASVENTVWRMRLG